MKKSAKMGWILPLVGLLLIVMAAQSVALKMVGKKAQAEVTEIKQVVDSSSEAMDHNYSIGYRFSVDGKSFTGQSRRNKVHNVSTLPKTGEAMTVLYLPAWPQINGDSKQGPLQAVFLGGLGLVLLVAGLKSKKKKVPATQEESNS